MSEIQWIKLYVNTFNTSRKVKQIEQMPGGDAVLVIWFKLLCLAGAVNDGGSIYVTSEIPFTVRGLARELRRPAKTVEKALDTLEQYGMILRDEEGFLRIASWGKYQDLDRLEKIRLQDRERQRRRRERQKRGEASGPHGDRHVTVTDGDAGETEWEEEEEESAQEFPSFPPSEGGETEQTEGRDADRERLRLKYLGGALGKSVVLLSEEQFDSLCDRLSLDELNKYIGIVRDCELNGQHYRKKSHYRAILDMAEQDRRLSRQEER